MIIQADELPKLQGLSVVFCSGSFDLLHSGHAWFLASCKNLGGSLVVAVGSDAMIRHRKPDRPIIEQAARLKMVDSLRPVDYCYLDTVSTPEFPLAAVEHAFAFLKPDGYVIEDDAFGIEERRGLCERYGVQLNVLNKRGSDFPEMSTTAIIEKIQKVIR